MDNAQYGPPGSADLLEEVVKHVSYKPGWWFSLEYRARNGEHLAGGGGLTLTVGADLPDSTNNGATSTGVGHFFAVPPAAYNQETWERWVLDCILQVELHEALEWFHIDDQVPFFPAHGDGNGNSPYAINRRHPDDNLPGAPLYT